MSAGCGRAVLFGLLLVVAVAAAVLSFAALRDLASLCGFAARLAWLLPVVVDAGAAAGSLVWLGGRASGAARRFARVLALGLLTLSVVANALGHGFEAYRLSPPWWVVVAVSAIAPAVLGAVVHLAVLVGRHATTTEAQPLEQQSELSGTGMAGLADESPAEGTDSAGGIDGELWGEDGWSRWWSQAPAVACGVDRAEVLIAAGVGRRRLARELGMSEYEARQLLAQSRHRPLNGEEPDCNSGASERSSEQGVGRGGVMEGER